MFRQIVALNLILFGLICCLTGTFAALSMGIFHSAAHPGKCTLDEFNLILAPGESAQWPQKCGLITCENAEGFVEFATCGVYSPPPGCRIVGSANPNAPYPECCAPKIVC